jgi:hypothetical protein
MNPATRIAAIIGASTLTLAGAGFALATVGQASSASTDAPAETPVAATQHDGPNLNALARELSRLDDRSSHLAALLADTRARADQVAARNSTVVAVAGSTSSGSSSGSSASTGHDDSDDSDGSSHGSTGSYQDDDRDDGYDDDAYEDDSDDNGDDHSEDAEYEEHEDESHDD